MTSAMSAPWFTVMVLGTGGLLPWGVATTVSVPWARVCSSTSNTRVWPPASVMPLQLTVPGPALPTATLDVQLPTGTAPVPR